MADPVQTKHDSLLYFVASLVIAIIAWPMALYSAHSAVFGANVAAGHSRTIFAIIVLTIALVSTWLAVFFGGRDA